VPPPRLTTRPAGEALVKKIQKISSVVSIAPLLVRRVIRADHKIGENDALHDHS
jgi:hypothetical protein